MGEKVSQGIHWNVRNLARHDAQTTSSVNTAVNASQEDFDDGLCVELTDVGCCIHNIADALLRCDIIVQLLQEPSRVAVCANLNELDTQLCIDR